MTREYVRPEDVFVENCKVLNARFNLRKYVVKWLKIPEICAECGLGTVWNHKTISLQVDHVNGVYDDNRPGNLRFLCPNCHSQTRTFCGRNKKKL